MPVLSAFSWPPAGKVGPNPAWYPAAALAAARPTRPSAQRTAASWFAAQFGAMPIVPRGAAAVYSPRIRFALSPSSFNDFVAFWTVRAALPYRGCKPRVAAWGGWEGPRMGRPAGGVACKS